jgi:hypothetical protein
MITDHQRLPGLEDANEMMEQKTDDVNKLRNEK